MTNNNSWDDVDDAADDAGRKPFKRLTPEEAQAVIAKLPPSASPWRVVAAQAAAGVLCAALIGLVFQQGGVGWSALYGAATVVVPSGLLARGMTRRSLNAVTAAAGFLVWEMIKIGVAVAMLLLAPKIVPQLSWPALLVTMVVCIKVNWLALLWQGPKKNLRDR